MTYINYNYAANLASNAIGRNDRALDSAMNRISTGTRIGNGSGESGMYAKYVELKAEAVTARQGLESVNRGLAKMKLIESQVSILGDIMIRMHELAEVAASADVTDEDRLALDGEFLALGTEARRITTETQFNGETVLQGDDLDIWTGGGTNVAVRLDDFQFNSQTATTGLGVATLANAAGAAGSTGGANASIDVTLDTTAGRVGPDTGLTSILTQATAELALAQLDNAAPNFAGAVGRLGGQVRQVEFAADSMAAAAVALESAVSGIRDADYAVETAKLASAQVISQAATAMVAQANARSTTVLALLQ